MNKHFKSLDDGRVTFRPPRLAVADVTTDPVCGAQIERGNAAGSSNHNGECLYFCSPACKLRFLEDPESYL